jgi:hypothetical protein
MSHAVKNKLSRLNTSFVAGAVVLAAPPLSAHTSAANEHAALGKRAARPSPDDRRFGRASQWIVSVDGLLTVSYVSEHETASYVDETGNPQGTKFESLSTVLLVPRLSVDAFVIDHLSVGLGATYSQNDSWYTTTSPDGTTTQQMTSSGVTVSPRVGLAYGSECGWGVWGRAGIVFGAEWQSQDSVQFDQSWGAYTLAASADVVATYAPRKDVVFTAGPWLKEGIASWTDSSSVQTTTAPPNIGMSIGAGLVL